MKGILYTAKWERGSSIKKHKCDSGRQTLSSSLQYLWKMSVIVLSVQSKLQNLSVNAILSACHFVPWMLFTREGVTSLNCRNFIFEIKTVQFEKRQWNKKQIRNSKEKKLKQGKNEGEAEMPALKPPYPECTFVLGGFLIALSWQPEQCWKALSLQCRLKMIFSIMHLASN